MASCGRNGTGPSQATSPLPSRDREVGRVAVADEEDADPVEHERLVDLEHVLLDRGVEVGAVADRRAEVLRLPVWPARPRGSATSKSSTVKLSGSRFAGSKSEPGAKSSYCGVELVKPLPTTHDRAALVAEELAVGEGEQHHDDADVEDQVADLAQVAALGRRACRRSRTDPVAAPAAQRGLGAVEHGGRRLVGRQRLAAYSGSRCRLRGACGGFEPARPASRRRSRGTMQPTSETISSR